MATISITFTGTNADLTAFSSSLADAYGYRPNLADGSANPESRQAFVVRRIKEEARSLAMTAKKHNAEQAARDAIAADDGIT